MGGIAGLVGPDPRHPVDPGLLSRMTGVIRHRGPDADGFHRGPGVGLGHRRLSIIDLSTGDQPMYNETRSVAVVFNGEIYNYPELARELEARGHTLATRSDTETLVHAYEDFGLEFVNRLRGMFASALWVASGRRGGSVLRHRRRGGADADGCGRPAGRVSERRHRLLRRRRLHGAAVRPSGSDDQRRLRGAHPQRARARTDGGGGPRHRAPRAP